MEEATASGNPPEPDVLLTMGTYPPFGMTAGESLGYSRQTGVSFSLLAGLLAR